VIHAEKIGNYIQLWLTDWFKVTSWIGVHALRVFFSLLLWAIIISLLHCTVDKWRNWISRSARFGLIQEVQIKLYSNNVDYNPTNSLLCFDLNQHFSIWRHWGARLINCADSQNRKKKDKYSIWYSHQSKDANYHLSSERTIIVTLYNYIHIYHTSMIIVTSFLSCFLSLVMSYKPCCCCGWYFLRGVRNEVWLLAIVLESLRSFRNKASFCYGYCLLTGSNISRKLAITCTQIHYRVF